MNNKGMREVIQKWTSATTNREFRQSENYLRVSFCFHSSAGTGKTTGIIDAGTEIGVPVQSIRFSQISDEDLIFPDLQEKKDNIRALAQKNNRALTKEEQEKL